MALHKNDLETNEMYLHNIMHNVQDGIIVANQDGYIESINFAACEIFGYEEYEIIGKQIDILIPKNDREPHSRFVKKYIKSYKPTIMGGKKRQEQAQHKNGRIFPIEIAISAIVNNDDLNLIAIFRDISEKIKIKQTLKIQNEFTSSVLQTVASLVVVLNSEGKIVEFNRACEMLTGHSKEYVKDKYIWDVILDSTDIEYTKLLTKLASSNQIHLQHRNRWITKSGKKRTIEWLNSVINNENGSLEYIIMTGLDITDRLQAEYILKNERIILEKAIKDRTREIKAILTLSPDGIVFFNNNSEILFVNPALLVMLGQKEENIIGLTENEFIKCLNTLKDPDIKDNFVLNTLSITETIQLVRPSRRILNCTLRIIEDKHEHGRILYFRDVTHETEVDMMKSEFLSTAAHELRTPLASIQGYSELLLKREYDIAQQKDMMKTIHRQANNLRNIINELLDLSRIETRSGKDYKIKPDTLEPLIKDTCKEIMGIFDSIKIKTEFLIDWPIVAYDYEKMHQVLTNVLDNACKYSPNGGEIICSTLDRVKDGQKQFAIQFKDSGIGMTPEEVARVGERFYRADNSGKIQGTGLGITLVKEIMKIHHGDVEITSIKNKGTTVTLWLPILTENMAMENIS